MKFSLFQIEGFENFNTEQLQNLAHNAKEVYYQSVSGDGVHLSAELLIKDIIHHPNASDSTKLDLCLIFPFEAYNEPKILLLLFRTDPERIFSKLKMFDKLLETNVAKNEIITALNKSKSPYKKYYLTKLQNYDIS